MKTGFFGTSVALLGAGIAESTERLELALVGGDFAGLLGNDGWGEGKGNTGGLGSELLGGRVALLLLASLLGEDNQPLLVRLQSCNVDILALLAQVPAAMVNNDTQPLGLLAPDASLLELGECESTALTDLGVIPHGLGTDSGAEEGERTNAKCGSFGDTGISSAEFAAGLVKPCAYAALPVFPEVIGVEDYERKSSIAWFCSKCSQRTYRCSFRNPWPKSVGGGEIVSILEMHRRQMSWGTSGRSSKHPTRKGIVFDATRCIRRWRSPPSTVAA